MADMRERVARLEERVESLGRQLMALSRRFNAFIMALLTLLFSGLLTAFGWIIKTLGKGG